MIGLWLAVWAGCGARVDCADPEAVAARAGDRALTCREAGWAVEWVALLAGRPVPPGDQRLAWSAVAGRFADDPEGTRAWLDGLRRDGAALADGLGIAGAEARAAAVYASHAGEGPIGPSDGALWALQKRALAVWASHDADRLALTEADLEAWIRYASLCREAQGGGVLRLSVADRVTVYRVLVDRFQGGSRAERVAMAAVGGPFWRQVHDRWPAATFERQQRWLAAAPLPPPMTATSLAYAEAVFNGDVARHAAALHEALGPMSVGGAERGFLAAPAP